MSRSLNKRIAIKAALTLHASLIDLQEAFALRAQGGIACARPAAMMRHAMGVVKQHHGKAGSQGYPMGLRDGEEMAQRLRLVDAFVANDSSGPKRPALDIKSVAEQVWQQEESLTP
ncbi:hypothetical protein [Roseateles sp.]|uniref:hypothetical protein n=1 Tax=Roseateles sp. TaxID=1971397 RepID=UPI003BA593EC